MLRFRKIEVQDAKSLSDLARSVFSMPWSENAFAHLAEDPDSIFYVALEEDVLIGGCGLPVFAGGRAGFGELFSATGGFLWSFPLLALMCGMGDKKGRPYLWGLLGLVVNYLAGAQQLAMVTSLSAAAWLLPGFVKDVFFVTLAHRVAGRIKRGAGLR